MPAAALDELYNYDQQYLDDILESVKTIAMVGASADKTKFSYGVLRVLHETGYDMIPVNPNPNLTEIRGIPVYHSLEEIDRPVDMVEVFDQKTNSTALQKRPSPSVRKCFGDRSMFTTTGRRSSRKMRA